MLPACLQEILPTVALAILAMPPTMLLAQSPKAVSSPLQQWQEYVMESGAEPLMPPTVIHVPLVPRPPYLATVKETEENAPEDDEKQFRGWTVGGVLWSLRQVSKRAQLLLRDSELMSAACMASLMLCLCVVSLYM